MLRYLIGVFALLSLLANVGAFTNPIKSKDGSDPFMVYSDGYYYLTTTTWSNIQLTRATTVEGLKTATPKVVWTDSTASRCCNMWAPEIHWMPSTSAWYIYYTAGDTAGNQRIHAIKGTSIYGTYSYAGRITVPNRDVWSIDATIMVLASGQYLAFSSWDGDTQCLYLAKMSSPTVIGNAVQISCPTNSWERLGGLYVNEGPAGLYHGGRTWIVYSASHCASQYYSLGTLELTGSDPLVKASWTKSSGAVFVSANGNYGPAHNGFFISPNGADIWMVYHASASSAVTCDGARRTMVQAVGWHSNGSPNFGSPRALTDSIPNPA